MPRREFLYDIRFWEARRIIRGYRRRNALQYQLQRIQAWASMFCMGNPKNVKPDEIFPLYCDHFDEYDEQTNPEVSQADIDELQELMRQENARMAGKPAT